MSKPAPPRARRRSLPRLGPSALAAALAAALAGCGSTAATITSHVSVRTRAGVRYSDGVIVRGKQQCSTQTFAILAAHVNHFTQTTTSCAPRSRPAGVMLIQIARPRTAFILDRPARGCGSVRITPTGGQPVVASSTCSATKPTLRLTALPPRTTMTIGGVAGVTRVALGDYRCSFICARLIATGAKWSRRKY